MDNNKKLAKELLRADGIDPENITESERTMLQEMLSRQFKSKPSKPKSSHQIWSIIMKSNITKIAAAITIVTALTIIYQLTGSIDGASIALADVAKKIEQMQNCVFEKTTTVFSKEENVTPLRAHKSEAYYTNGAYREDEFHDEMVIKQIYVNFSERTLIAIGHEMMVYKELKLTEEDVVELAPIGPNNLVSQILSKGDYKVLGRKTVDGILSEGFEFDDKRTLLSMDKEKTQQITVRLWVDVNTNLPVCVEADSVYNNLQVSVVQHNPTWNIELDADFFEPKIPADYITLEQRGLIGVDLENWPTLKVVPGMAAEKAGLKDGDIVIKIDDKNIEHVKSPDEAQKCLFGKAGEKVTLTVKRGEHFLTLEVIREPLPK